MSAETTTAVRGTTIRVEGSFATIRIDPPVMPTKVYRTPEERKTTQDLVDASHASALGYVRAGQIVTIAPLEGA